ncbi:hypothetical protein P7K49_035726, partial [Saguinus oedipus]
FAGTRLRKLPREPTEAGAREQCPGVSFPQGNLEMLSEPSKVPGRQKVAVGRCAELTAKPPRAHAERSGKLPPAASAGNWLGRVCPTRDPPKTVRL